MNFTKKHISTILKGTGSLNKKLLIYVMQNLCGFFLRPVKPSLISIVRGIELWGDF